MNYDDSRMALPVLALSKLLDVYRDAASTEREKRTYFEEPLVHYFRNEASYRDLYDGTWPYAEWARMQGLSGKDTGIDLVAHTRGTGEFHAIQCKPGEQQATAFAFAPSSANVLPCAPGSSDGLRRAARTKVSSSWSQQ